MTSQLYSERVRVCAQRLQESGVAALSGLFDLTSQRLVRLAVTITGNQHDAEDAVQATLVKVADRPGLLATADQPWPYLLRMVRNSALVILKRKKRVASVDGITDLVAYCPVDEAEQEDTHRAVWAALRTLPAEQSEVVVLKVWEELTFAQIASVLDVNASTVASRYRYALEKLSQRLGAAREVIHER